MHKIKRRPPDVRNTQRQVAPLSSEPPVYLNVVFDTEVNVCSEDMIVIAPPAGGAKPLLQHAT